MDKDKIVTILTHVGVIRVRSVPLITHLMKEFKLNWYTAKRWHEILSKIPLETTFDEDGNAISVPSTEVSKYSPKREDRTEAFRRERLVGACGDDSPDENPEPNKLADGSLKSAKIHGHVIVVGEVLKGYGRITRISTNQFGDYLIKFELEDGSEYEVSEFHLDMNAIRSR